MLWRFISMHLVNVLGVSYCRDTAYGLDVMSLPAGTWQSIGAGRRSILEKCGPDMYGIICPHRHLVRWARSSQDQPPEYVREETLTAVKRC